MMYEVMVLFGGSLILISLRRNRVRSRARIKGFLKITAMVVEMLVLVTGIVIFTVGLVEFIS